MNRLNWHLFYFRNDNSTKFLDLQNHQKSFFLEYYFTKQIVQIKEGCHKTALSTKDFYRISKYPDCYFP